MNKSLRNRIIFILGILAASIYFAFPLQKHINLGLDLKGGMHLVIQVETEGLPENAKSDAVSRAIEILRNRIDSIGAGETVIQRQGESQILIQLPGVTDREKAKAVIGTVAKLEFHLVQDDPANLQKAVEGQVIPGYILKYVKETQAPILIEEKPSLSGDTVADARVDLDRQGFGQPYISMRLNAQGAKDFATLTRENVGHRLAIILDNEVLSAPNIQEAIPSGNAQISGQFSFEEASVLALSLRSGALPAPMHIEEERTIGPLLGKDSIDAGIRAAILGVTILFIFMALYYIKAGLIADITLALNLLLIIGTMGFLKVMLPQAPMTLTLPGIAGIILTLGMAVDANVLINERIREEINSGRPMQAAINNGFQHALSAIIDSNVTTLIAAFMLFQFGSGPIKGFAVTLSIGLLTSMFTAVFVSRALFQLLFELKFLQRLPMFSIFSEPKFNFLSKKLLFCSLSGILVIASLIAIILKQNTMYGIDFAGGQIQEYRFSRTVQAEDLRRALKEINLDDAVIQRFDQYPQNVIVRTPADTYNQVSEVFKKSFPDNPFETLRIEQVGPLVGKELRQRAIWAIVFALGGILVYVAFRFKHFDFAVGGVVALLHDVFVALGVMVMMGRQVDLLVVTALLTIAGYSINDTIVIYDRVRENLRSAKRMSLVDVINLSLNQTLSRTILTTAATLIVVVALFLRGGEVLNNFSLCLLIGFIAGTYSTVFIASPIVLAMQKKFRHP